MKKIMLATAALAVLTTTPLWAADKQPVLNIYSGRGAAADEDLYGDFIQQTDIRINRTENDGTTTLEILKNQGKDADADVVLLNGLARLHSAQAEGLLHPVQSDALDAAVPQGLRAARGDGGTPWFGLAWHARVIVYDPEQVQANDVQTYEQLADHQNKGKLCMTRAAETANLGLLAALIEHDGSEKTQSWLQGIAGNLARTPSGTDTDQINAVATGECKIALADHFSLAHLMRSDNMAERNIANSVAVVFPNQDSWGTHIDIAGAAVARHAKHPKAAIQFLEYLVSEQGQNLFANSNDEWPVVEKLKFANDPLQTLLGKQKNFKRDATPLHQIATHLDAAHALAERVDFK